MTATHTTSAAAPAGPLDTQGSRYAVWSPVPYHSVRLDERRFVGGWQRRNTDASIPHCIEALTEHGALSNLRDHAAGRTGTGHRGQVFSDSDVYKVLEATAWDSGRTGGTAYSGFIDDAVRLLQEAQETDGYLNSAFTETEHFSDLRWGHELYCIGHLIQAAVALHRAGGDSELVPVAERAAALVERETAKQDSAGLCGHPEIEMALVELYRLTGARAWLDLAGRMIDLRGHGRLGEGPFAASYFQDHTPVREAREATGHAVRQLYLMAGVADVYLETGEKALLAAMQRVWTSVIEAKTHLTGGIGSRHRDESFGDSYELPAERAYAETCAAVASLMWNWRLLLATGEGSHADEMERVLYNAIAAGVGLDGKTFSYSNPLQIRTEHDGTDQDSPAGRLAWFDCACCPPNLARLVSSIHTYLITSSPEGVQFHLYAAGEYHLQDCRLQVDTDYPWDGSVKIITDRPLHQQQLKLRIPGWCTSYTVTVDGVQSGELEVEDGYVTVPAGTMQRTLRLDLEMPVIQVTAHPHVDALRGCAALTRGPLVYCIEAADLPEEAFVEDIYLDPDCVPVALPGTTPEIPVLVQAQGWLAPAGPGLLYRRPESGPDLGHGSGGHPPERIDIRAVPYFTWANRDVGAMRVWIPTMRLARGKCER